MLILSYTKNVHLAHGCTVAIRGPLNAEHAIGEATLWMKHAPSRKQEVPPMPAGSVPWAGWARTKGMRGLNIGRY